MKTVIDEQSNLVTLITADGRTETFPIDSAEGFAAASKAWLRVGWDTKHVYSFTWMGRPIIQLPEDMVRLQELIWTEKPSVIIETGIAHGGSLVFYASLFEAMGEGRVIGIDIEIRPHNRAAIEAHPMIKRIAMIEGSSIDPDTVSKVQDLIVPGDRVMIILDSNHSREHVLSELHAYAPMVSVGGYLVATDGVMQQMAGAPRSESDWKTNNPLCAAQDFVAQDDRFQLSEPQWLFNEGAVRERVTYWPGCYVKRVR